MCLSIAYRNQVDDDHILMKNVASVTYLKDHIVLIDLMERELTIEGGLEKANFLDNYLIIRTKEPK